MRKSTSAKTGAQIQARAERFHMEIRAIQSDFKTRLARMLSQTGSRGQLTSAQFLLMRQLLHAGPQPISALAAWSQVNPATMTPMIDKLERQGFAVRRTHAEDKRSILVCLTEDGIGFVRQMEDRWKQEMASPFLALTGREQARLLELLDKVKRHMHEPDNDGWN